MSLYYFIVSTNVFYNCIRSTEHYRAQSTTAMRLTQKLVCMARCRRYLRSVTAAVGAERLPPAPTAHHRSTPKGVPQQEDMILSTLLSQLSTPKGVPQQEGRAQLPCGNSENGVQKTLRLFAPLHEK